MKLTDRIRRWWYRRQLHEECVMYQIYADRGRVVPYGACVDCYPRFRWLQSMAMPVARTLAARGGRDG